MSSLMEDDYAPATRHLWPSIVSTILIIALAVFAIYRQRNSEPEHPLRRLQHNLEELLERARAGW